jgi:hypothetical protein
MIIALIALVLYVYIGSFTGTQFYAWRVRQCSKCQDEFCGMLNAKGKPVKCETWHSFVAVLFGAAWPVAVPAAAGHKTAEVTVNKQTSRVTELQQAMVDRQIAEHKAAENAAITAILSKDEY